MEPTGPAVESELTRLNNEKAKTLLDLPVLLIKCESRSSRSQHERGYHDYQTTVEGYQASFYAPQELERLRKESMWCEMMKQEGNKFTIRHGYDSGD